MHAGSRADSEEFPWTQLIVLYKSNYLVSSKPSAVSSEKPVIANAINSSVWRFSNPLNPPFSKGDFSSNSLQFPPFLKGGRGDYILWKSGPVKIFGNHYKSSYWPVAQPFQAVPDYPRVLDAGRTSFHDLLSEALAEWQSQ